MLATVDDVLIFWLTPWSEALRSTCVWLERFGPPISGKKKPDDAAPKWVRPLCLQRWVAQAIAARLAWIGAHPEQEAYCYGRESEPCWEAVAWASYDWRCLRTFSEATLLWLFGMEVERLLRIMQEAPSLVGGVDWTRATLGASEHLIQVYKELKRRQPACGDGRLASPGSATLAPVGRSRARACAGQGRALRARGILREALRRFSAGEAEHL